MDSEAPPRSPAGRTTQTLIAVAFLAVWLGATLYDFFANARDPVLPVWFHLIGVLVLGFLLGLNFEAAAGRFRR